MDLLVIDLNITKNGGVPKIMVFKIGDKKSVIRNKFKNIKTILRV